MEELNLNIEDESKEIISILMPAITNTSILENVEIEISDFCKNRYDDLLYPGAYVHIVRPITLVLDSAIKKREWVKQQNEFQARVAMRTYNAQMSEPERGLGFGIITNDFLSAASYIVLDGFEAQKQIINKTINAEKTLIDNLSKLNSSSAMYKSDVMDMFTAVNTALRNLVYLQSIKSFLADNYEFYVNKTTYDIGTEINGINVYDLIAGTVSDRGFVGYRRYRDGLEILSVLEAKGYIKILPSPPRGEVYFVTTTKFESESLATLYYEEHPEEKAKVDEQNAREFMAAYEEAEKLYQSGKYYEAATLFAQLDSIEGSVEKSISIWNQNIWCDKLISIGTSTALAINTAGKLLYETAQRSDPLETEAISSTVTSWNGVIQAELDYSKVIALCSDGTVKTLSEHIYRATDLAETPCVLGNGSKWKGLSAISYGGSHLAGLYENGTVSAVGFNKNGECNVNNWTEIQKVVCNEGITVGLKRNGTVCVAGNSELVNKCNSWSNIVDIIASGTTIVGLKSNGKVVAVAISDGNHEYVNEVQNWENIVKIQAKYDYIIGLKSDGSIVYAGRQNDVLRLFLEAQDKVVQVVDDIGIIVLHADGTVTTKNTDYEVSKWKNIVYVTGDKDYICGVCSDGTVVVEGKNKYDLDITKLRSWRIFSNINSYKKDKTDKIEKHRQAEQDKAKNRLSEARAELKALKGLFTGKRRRKLEIEIQSLEARVGSSTTSEGTKVDELDGCENIEVYIKTHFSHKEKAKAVKFYRSHLGVSLNDAFDAVSKMGF